MRLVSLFGFIGLLVSSSNLAAQTAQVVACPNPVAGDSFVDARVRNLDPNFNFDNNGYSLPLFGGTYTAPAASSKITDANEKTDLAAAFDLAPAWLQTALCKIDGVFIDNGNYPAVGWAFWENDQQAGANPPKKWIALSSGLWSPATYNQLKLSSLEDGILQALLGIGPGDATQSPYSSSSIINGIDTAQTAILAVVAHEMGHLYEAIGVGGTEPVLKWRNCGCADGTQKCAFFKGSWDKYARSDGPIHHFGQGVSGPRHANNHELSLSDIRQQIVDDEALTPPDFQSSAEDLINIYGNKWINLFASVAPDEDFVETFKYIVLRNSKDKNNKQVLATLTFTLNNASSTSENITSNASDLNGPLNRKGKCIITNLNLPNTFP